MKATIKLDQIIVDSALQPREHMSTDWVSRLAEHLEEGGKFRDAIVVFADGDRYYLADGFHRVAAYRQVGFVEVEAEIRQGTKRDALWSSFAANRDQLDLPRAPGDAKRVIEAILRDPEWSKTPQTKIAEHVGVTQGYVSQVHAHLITANKIPPRGPVEVNRGGTTYTQDTSNIGKTPKKPAAPPPPPEYPRTRVGTPVDGVIVDDDPFGTFEDAPEPPDTGKPTYSLTDVDKVSNWVMEYLDLTFKKTDPAIHRAVLTDVLKRVRERIREYETAGTHA